MKFEMIEREKKKYFILDMKNIFLFFVNQVINSSSIYLFSVLVQGAFFFSLLLQMTCGTLQGVALSWIVWLKPVLTWILLIQCPLMLMQDHIRAGCPWVQVRKRVRKNKTVFSHVFRFLLCLFSHVSNFENQVCSTPDVLPVLGHHLECKNVF